MSNLSPQLTAIGAELERRIDAQLGASERRRRQARRRLAIAIAAAVLAVPAGAIAVTSLVNDHTVAQSLPAGTKALIGTDPTCTARTAGVEYHCTTARPPSPEVSDWKGTVEPTVDATKHVNGGCRSLRSDGTEWECYVGESAVQQQIIGRGFLGQYAPSPGVG
jgi:hypothetical protein